MNRDAVTDATVVQTEAAPVVREAAEEAVRALLLWAGDDPAREGLFDTPRRVANAYEEFFAGYRIDPEAYLERAFEETDGYDEMVVLRDIEFVSHCEHHVVPIIGKAHVTYLPNRRVVGISKTARVVEAYTRRLQNPRTPNLADRECVRKSDTTARDCSCHRSRISMHDDPRSQEARVFQW